MGKNRSPVRGAASKAKKEVGRIAANTENLITKAVKKVVNATNIVNKPVGFVMNTTRKVAKTAAGSVVRLNKGRHTKKHRRGRKSRKHRRRGKKSRRRRRRRR